MHDSFLYLILHPISYFTVVKFLVRMITFYKIKFLCLLLKQIVGTLWFLSYHRTIMFLKNSVYKNKYELTFYSIDSHNIKGEVVKIIVIQQYIIICYCSYSLSISLCVVCFSYIMLT